MGRRKSTITCFRCSGPHFLRNRVNPYLNCSQHLFVWQRWKGQNHEMKVTAQVTLQVEADGVSVPVLLFVQPNSSQPCLIGMNAAPALGLKFLNATGQPLRKAGTAVTGNPCVSLIQSKAVPARATSFVEAVVEMKLLEGAQILFERSGLTGALRPWCSRVTCASERWESVHPNVELSAKGGSFGRRHEVGAG